MCTILVPSKVGNSNTDTDTDGDTDGGGGGGGDGVSVLTNMLWRYQASRIYNNPSAASRRISRFEICNNIA
jgi:hypothetical protein